ncbi:3'-5' exonuclease [Amycolatopsis sp. K13G38]|uniref:3'-5' exonuclease n=1 Tax=Amycolatopsis acididurans TaxID=2724524 RepID=A0ABX1J112_9PSEU|nr:3'-5' exonuclease [Amycolatopsis acididurans]NKQ53453.1 3'-5' exonuclease [Amycolatopsis acididurans]
MTALDTLSLTKDGRFPAAPVEFTALDFTTSGLRPGHVLEIGAVRTRSDGTVVGELSSLVNPGWGIGVGAAGLHHITRRDLDDAPCFGELLGTLLDLCRGSVLAAHNLPLADWFLGTELARARVSLPPLPAIGTLDPARRALRLPNYQLTTVAGALGLADFPAHQALARARTCASVVSSLVTTHGFALAEPPAPPELPRFTAVHPLPRRENRPVESWLAGLLVRVPLPGNGDAIREAYRDLLALALADQYVSPDEARELSALALDAGIPVPEIRQTHQRFVAAMREIAEEDGVITSGEVRDLGRVAAALGVPEVVAGLRPMAQRQPPTRVLVLGETAAADALRAAVLGAGSQLAKRLTESVTQLVVADDVPRRDPRIGRAADLGIVVLDVSSAWTALGLIAPFEPRTSLPESVLPWQRWAARALMAMGLLVMLLSVIVLFGGAPFVGGAFMAAFGVAALLGGWYLTEPATG